MQKQQQRVKEHSSIADGVKDKKSAFERPAQEATRPPVRPPTTKKKTVPVPRRPEPEPEPEPEPQYEPEPEPEPEPQYEPEPESEPIYEIEPEPEAEPEPDTTEYVETLEQEGVEESLYDDLQQNDG